MGILRKIATGITLSSFAFALHAQTVVKGVVTDEQTGEPLTGATVAVKNEKGEGVITDVDGRFRLTTKEEAPLTLNITFIGYRDVDIDVYDPEELVVVYLTEKRNFLDEVVVVGYGTQKRQELTSSITTVNKDLVAQNVSSVESLLSGAVAGLNVTTTSGQPGAASIMRIRGGNSINGGNEPLYVIDGLIIYNDPASTRTDAEGIDATLDPLAFLNPADIESIEVLKDVSATAIYGTRGANGVIIITTKKGNRRKGTINYSASFSWSTIAKKLEYLDAWEWAEMYNEIRANEGIDDVLDTPTQTYDWQDAALQTGFAEEHQFSVIGGDDISRFNISAGYLSQEGIVIGTDQKRYTGRINYERNVIHNLLVGATANGAYNKVNGLYDTGEKNSWGQAISHTPYTSIYNEDGSYNYDPTPSSLSNVNGAVGNPISDLVNTKAQTVNTRVIANAFAEWEVVPKLKLKASFGADLSSTRQDFYAPSYTTAGLEYSGYASVGETNTRTWQTEYTANYSNVLNKVHSVSLLAGYTAQRTDRNTFATTAYGFSNDVAGSDNIAAAETILSTSSEAFVSTLQSWLGRVNYSFDQRYNASLTIRADGSSRFAKNHRWGWFPSAGFSWNIDKEKFINLGQNVDFLNLRLSVGTVGNQEIGDYQFSANMVPTTVSVDGTTTTGYIIDNMANTELKWETTTSYNVGLNAGFFNNRLTVNLDYYYKKTNDLLLDVPVEGVTGFSSILRNVGSVTNKGVELEIGAVLIQKKNWSWNANFSIAHNSNKVTSLGDAEYIIPSFSSVGTLTYIDPLIVKVGEPLGSFYGYKFVGIVQEDTDVSTLPSQTVADLEPGNPIFEDTNGDGVVNESDRVVLGNIQPDFTFGINTKLQWKSFDLLVTIAGSYGNQLFNALACRLEKGNFYWNALASVVDRWTTTNPSNTIQKASSSTSIYSDDRYVEDASYLKFRNIQLGYTLPPLKFISKNARLRVYVALQNFFTITGYSGYDPEANRNGIDETSSLYQGVDFGAYPAAKTVKVGFNLTL